MSARIARVVIRQAAIREVASSAGVRDEVERLAGQVAEGADAELPRVRGRLAAAVAYRSGSTVDDRGAVGYAGSDNPLSWLVEHGTARMPAHAPLRTALDRL